MSRDWTGLLPPLLFLLGVKVERLAVSVVWGGAAGDGIGDDRACGGGTSIVLSTSASERGTKLRSCLLAGELGRTWMLRSVGLDFLDLVLEVEAGG